MLSKQLEYIRSKTDFTPEIGIVLGSGLGSMTALIDEVASVSYSEIEGFPVSTAPSHNGRFVFGYIENKKVAVMDGRVHLYEGYTPEEVVAPIRLMKLMGCEKLILTNASGGINKELNAGDILLIKDHISQFVRSPLVGKNDDSLGLRFPDMSRVYDSDLKETAKKCAKKLGIELKEGVYVQVSGPQFETPAEIKMLGLLGADAVGMSTVVEAIAARHCGLKVCGLSLIANLACGLLDKPLTSEEVVETAEKTKEKFQALITGIIKEI